MKDGVEEKKIPIPGECGIIHKSNPLIHNLSYKEFGLPIKQHSRAIAERKTSAKFTD